MYIVKSSTSEKCIKKIGQVKTLKCWTGYSGSIFLPTYLDSTFDKDEITSSEKTFGEQRKIEI